MLAAHHPAATHADQDSDSVIAVSRVPDDVRVTGADHLDTRWGIKAFEPAQRVTQLAGALEVIAIARVDHRLAHLYPDVLRPSFEKVENILYHPAVVALALPTDARREAAADVIVETGTFAGLVRYVVRAAPYGVQPSDDRQRSPELGDIGVGAEVAGPGDVAPPRHQDPREGIGERHRNRRVALVILETDVESRPILLDQRVLEDERLGLRRHDDRLDVGDEPLEEPVLGARIVVGREVAADAALQALGLADVQHVTRGILPEIDARTIGEGIELALQRFGNVRGGHYLRRRRSPPASATPSPAVSARYTTPYVPSRNIARTIG